MDLLELRRLVRNGEGKRLEFKRKVADPEKVAREIVAFANTLGGTLLIGVDDDSTIYGSKNADEEEYQLKTFLQRYTTPRIKTIFQRVPVNATREVIAIEVPESRRKPHFILPNGNYNLRKTYTRVNDMSITASKELMTVMVAERKRRGVSFAYGEFERQLMRRLDVIPRITLEETRELLRVSHGKASTTLVQLVCAGILTIHPTEKGDYFMLAESAFRL